MSGNHNTYTAHGAELTELEKLMRKKFGEKYNCRDGWYDEVMKYQHTGVEYSKHPSMLVWRVYEQAFYDGFTAKLSGVKDE